MYLRNVKQILRAAEGGFDERRYGFGGLMDLLKACQRDGLVRVERDRRGGLRVFQGSTMARTAVATAPPMSAAVSEQETIDVQAEVEPIEAEAVGTETVTVVDTTAELLGRRKAEASPRAGRQLGFLRWCLTEPDARKSRKARSEEDEQHAPAREETAISSPSGFTYFFVSRKPTHCFTSAAEGPWPLSTRPHSPWQA